MRRYTICHEVLNARVVIGRHSHHSVAMSRSPQRFQNFDVTFPHERVIQVTLTRTGKLNCIDKATSKHIAGIWQRFDEDESLWVGIITGAGRAFCTGADLTGNHRLPCTPSE